MKVVSCSYFLYLLSYPLFWCSVTQACLTLCNPMDCSPPGSSVHGISRGRIMEWVAIAFSRGSNLLCTQQPGILLLKYTNQILLFLVHKPLAISPTHLGEKDYLFILSNSQGPAWPGLWVPLWFHLPSPLHPYSAQAWCLSTSSTSNHKLTPGPLHLLLQLLECSSLDFYSLFLHSIQISADI